MDVFVHTQQQHEDYYKKKAVNAEATLTNDSKDGMNKEQISILCYFLRLLSIDERIKM